jgi:hypothetical protein
MGNIGQWATVIAAVTVGIFQLINSKYQHNLQVRLAKVQAAIADGQEADPPKKDGGRLWRFIRSPWSLLVSVTLPIAATATTLWHNGQVTRLDVIVTAVNAAVIIYQINLWFDVRAKETLWDRQMMILDLLGRHAEIIGQQSDVIKDMHGIQGEVLGITKDMVQNHQDMAGIMDRALGVTEEIAQSIPPKASRKRISNGADAGKADT